MSHFEGKPALEHVIEARRKGAIAASEIHGVELAPSALAFLRSMQEMAFLLALIVLLFPTIFFPYLPLVAIGWTLWRTGQGALQGWLRLGRLHRLIEEERWEIEHHRPQEKEELRALYAARGFSGKLLDEAIEVLMADDNRLLQVMLEEELGLSLESYEHPLKQALGAFSGAVISGMVLILSFYFLPVIVSFGFVVLLVAISALIRAKKEKHSPISIVVWDLGILLVALLAALFLREQYVSPLPL